MKKIFGSLLVVFFMSAFGLNAQQTASQLLEKVVEKTRSYDNIRFDFTYQMLNSKAGIDESRNGILYLKDASYRLEMDGQLIISDGKVVWTYLEDSEEVMITDVSNDDEAISPNTLLTSYNKDYKATFANNASHAGPGLKIIELKPEKQKNFSAVQLVVNEPKLQIKNLIINDNGGNTFIYDLSQMKVNNTLKSNFFSFDEKMFPGVEVIDMR